MTKTSTKAQKPLHEFRHSLKDITFEKVCEAFEKAFGRGWKRRLAEVAEVPESTVHSWLKVGKGPKWLTKVFRLMLERTFYDEAGYYQERAAEDFQQAYQIVESGDGFAVYRFRNAVGQLVADRIPDLDTATEIASLPRAKATIKELIEELDVFAEFEIGKERAVAEFVKDACRWCRRADLNDLRWEPDVSRTIISSLMDTIRIFGTEVGSGGSTEAKEES